MGLWKSIPKEKTMYGVTIKKLNNRKTYQLIGKLEDLPENFLHELFPKLDSEQIIDKFIGFTADDLLKLIPNLIKIVPEKATKLISEVLECDVDYIMDKLSPIETAEILMEFYKVNRLGELQTLIKEGLEKLLGTWTQKNKATEITKKAMIMNTGSRKS